MPNSKQTQRKRRAMPVRQLQKQERHEAILGAAKELIAIKGYDKATIEDIAAAARLSPATVYNYFGAKLDILMALFIEDREIAYDKAMKVIERNWKSPLEFFLALMEADLHEEVQIVSHSLWRQIAAAELVYHEGRYQEIFHSMADRMGRLIATAIRKMIEINMLRPDTDVSVAKDVFISINEGIYRRIIATENLPFPNFRSDARKQLRVLVSAFAPA